MDFKVAQAELLFVKKQRNTLLMTTALFAAGLLINSAGWFYALAHQKTFIIPETANKAFYVSNHSVSDSYLEALATYFVNNRFNVTPSNINTSHKRILKALSSASFDNIEQALLKEQRFYKSENISSDFKITDIEINGEQLRGSVMGTLSLLSGGNVFKTQAIQLSLQFAFIQGELKITRFDKVATHEN